MEYRIKDSAKGYAEPIKNRPGSFRLYFSLGKDTSTGKYLRSPKRTYHCKSKNPKNWKSECDKALEAYKDELLGTSRSSDLPLTVSGYAEEFHRLRKDEVKSPLSHNRENYDIRHIRELFGDMPLKALRPDDIRRAYANARDTGRFSESELHRIHVKLRQIMECAVDDEIIDRNPCRKVKAPKMDLKPRETLEISQLPDFYNRLLAEPMSPATVCTMLLFHLGLRKGEALGLSWNDYSSSDDKIRIRWQYTNDKQLRPPKSDMSNRDLAVNPSLKEYLERWKTLQASELNQLGLKQTGETPIVHSIGLEKVTAGRLPYVTRMDGHNFGRWFRNYCVDNGYGQFETVTHTFARDGKTIRRGKDYVGLTPHGLRHTVATVFAAEGTDVKTIQAWLGHASATTTLNMYVRAVGENNQAAASLFDGLVHKS